MDASRGVGGPRMPTKEMIIVQTEIALIIGLVCMPPKEMIIVQSEIALRVGSA